MGKKIFFILTIISAMLISSQTVAEEKQITSAKTTQTQQNQYKKYTGFIGSYPITLFIDAGISENNRAGYYYYDERPETKFTLKMIKNEGHPKGFNKLRLNEYTPKGNLTGRFEGIIEGRGDGFYGTFVNRQGKKYQFNLKESN